MHKIGETVEIQLKDLNLAQNFIGPQKDYKDIPDFKDSAPHPYPYDELEKDIKQNGLKQPVKVVLIYSKGKICHAEIIDGHHRWLVLKKLYEDDYMIKCEVYRIVNLDTHEGLEVWNDIYKNSSVSVSPTPNKIVMIPLNSIMPDPLYQETVRNKKPEEYYDSPYSIDGLMIEPTIKDWTKGSFKNLEESIIKNGLQTPLTLMDTRMINDEGLEQYKLLIGQRRWLVLNKLYGKTNPVKCTIWYIQHKIPTAKGFRGPLTSQKQLKEIWSNFITSKGSMYDVRYEIHKDGKQIPTYKPKNKKVNQTKKDLFN